MNKTNLLILLLIVLIGAMGAFIFFQGRMTNQEDVSIPAATETAEPIKKPIIHYPVPEPVQTEVPVTDKPAQKNEEKKPVTTATAAPVQETEQSVEQVLQQLVTDTSILDLLYLENFIQRFVLMIDNLPEKSLPRAYMPLKAPGGRFIVSGTEDAPQTSSRNHKRYQRYVKLLQSINPELAIKFYTHFYPLFQKAYEQLGYKNAYFNDRLIFTLDHLLDTPAPKEPILLSQPSVLYIYADPLLEQRSVGQKILIRIGPENRTKVLNVLADFRRELSNLHP